MNRLACEEVRDLLPDWMADVLDGSRKEAVGDHLAGCEACREEEALLRAVLHARPEPPAGLAERIQARVRQEMAGVPAKGEGKVFRVRPRTWSHWTPAWALSAAAVVVLSLGIGVMWNGEDPEVVTEPLEVAVQEPIPEAWLWDDGFVAGAPVYDDLTDEELQALIEEMEG